MRKRKRAGERLALSPEPFVGEALTQLSGRHCVTIEQHRGILVYTDEEIRLAVRHGSIRIIGAELRIARMTSAHVEIRGTIRGVELE